MSDSEISPHMMNRAQVMEILRREIRFHGSMRKLAREAGMNPKSISAVVSSDRPFPKPLLEYLGLTRRRVIAYFYEPISDED